MTGTRRSLRISGLAGLGGLLTVLVGGCPLFAPETVFLDADDSGRFVKVEVGARLVVRLDSNPSTGYEWELADLDTSVLESTSNTYRSTTSAIGGGGIETWTFTALSLGTTFLRLIYHQPWEDVEPSRTFELTVTVEPGMWDRD